MKCNERLKLLTAYENAVVDASLAKNAYSKVAGNAALVEQNQLLRVEQETEKNIIKARSAYEEHIVEHGCAGQ